MGQRDDGSTRRSQGFREQKGQRRVYQCFVFYRCGAPGGPDCACGCSTQQCTVRDGFHQHVRESSYGVGGEVRKVYPSRDVSFLPSNQNQRCNAISARQQVLLYSCLQHSTDSLLVFHVPTGLTPQLISWRAGEFVFTLFSCVVQYLAPLIRPALKGLPKDAYCCTFGCAGSSWDRCCALTPTRASRAGSCRPAPSSHLIQPRCNLRCNLRQKVVAGVWRIR